MVLRESSTLQPDFSRVTVHSEKTTPYLDESSTCRQRLANPCLDAGEYKDAVQKGTARVGELSMDCTPTFLLARSSPDRLAGVRAVGAQAYAAFEAVIKGLDAHG